jgi:aryl-alcohol dehydrogenase-like predicted oxidoreductase
MLNRRASNDLIPYCQEHQISLLASNPLAQGLLAGRFTPQSTIPPALRGHPAFLGQRFNRNLELIERLRTIANRYDKTLAQLTLNWTICQPGITTVLFGAKRPSQVHENADAHGWEIEPTDRDQITTWLDDL